jgi:2-dehydropantoate 2-reductase
MIKQKGLRLINEGNEVIAYPQLATDLAIEIGRVNYIIVCCKSYDLEQIIIQLKPCIDENTTILPLLNGVESTDKIKQINPTAEVLKGCVYIVSSIKDNGIIEKNGNIQRIIFGTMNNNQSSSLQLKNIFNQAGLDAVLSDEIDKAIWEKFFMISANSTATSYFNCNIGSLFESPQAYNFLIQLLKEINTLALAKGIIFTEDMIDKTILKLKSLPYETSSSMHRDFLKINGRTELESITGYVVTTAKLFNISTPTFEQAYYHLQNKK